MSYLDIDNLYKNQDILLFKECYALEKIHGTSAHVRWDGGLVTFFAGGESHEKFVALFSPELCKLFEQHLGMDVCCVYGEAYGGKQQGMAHTYGKDLKFVVFDVMVNHNWLSVPQAEALAGSLGLEFAHYDRIATSLDELNRVRDEPSVQAARNGITEPKLREGVVLRPLIEVTKNNGKRIIAKHKGDAFAEHKRPPKVVVAGELEILRDAEAVADQWVVPMRLDHILQELPDAKGLEDTGTVIRAMLADIRKESEGEIEWSPFVNKAISKKAAELWKKRVANLLEVVG
jgi:hypothetical protein